MCSGCLLTSAVGFSGGELGCCASGRAVIQGSITIKLATRRRTDGAIAPLVLSPEHESANPMSFWFWFSLARRATAVHGCQRCKRHTWPRTGRINLALRRRPVVLHRLRSTARTPRPGGKAAGRLRAQARRTNPPPPRGTCLPDVVRLSAAVSSPHPLGARGRVDDDDESGGRAR